MNAQPIGFPSAKKVPAITAKKSMRSKTSPMNSEDEGRMDEPRWYAVTNRKGQRGVSDDMMMSRSNLVVYNSMRGCPNRLSSPVALSEGGSVKEKWAQPDLNR